MVQHTAGKGLLMRILATMVLRLAMMGVCVVVKGNAVIVTNGLARINSAMQNALGEKSIAMAMRAGVVNFEKNRLGAINLEENNLVKNSFVENNFEENNFEANGRLWTRRTWRPGQYAGVLS